MSPQSLSPSHTHTRLMQRPLSHENRLDAQVVSGAPKGSSCCSSGMHTDMHRHTHPYKHARTRARTHTSMHAYVRECIPEGQSFSSDLSRQSLSLSQRYELGMQRPLSHWKRLARQVVTVTSVELSMHVRWSRSSIMPKGHPQCRATCWRPPSSGTPKQK